MILRMKKKTYVNELYIIKKKKLDRVMKKLRKLIKLTTFQPTLLHKNKVK